LNKEQQIRLSIGGVSQSVHPYYDDTGKGRSPFAFNELSVHVKSLRVRSNIVSKILLFGVFVIE
jgi:hypothetical protein